MLVTFVLDALHEKASSTRPSKRRVGAQSAIGNRQLAIGNKSNRRLAMRDEAQQTIDAQMQQYINDDRDYQR